MIYSRVAHRGGHALLLLLAFYSILACATLVKAEPAFIHAIATAKPGDTITIPAGAFAITTLKMPNGVHVQGESVRDTQVTIQAGGAGIVFDGVKNAAISRLTLVNQASAAVTITHAQVISVQSLYIRDGLQGVKIDGSYRIMSNGRNSLGFICKMTGLDEQQRPVYDFSAKNYIPLTAGQLGSPYRPEDKFQVGGAYSSLMPDGGLVLGCKAKDDPIGMGLSNSGALDVDCIDKDGALKWLLPLNDYGPVQGVSSLGNFILTCWGHQAEWIGLDTDGLILGHFGYPEAGNWGGYWLDHPGHWQAFENPDGTVSIVAGDYMRNCMHWMRLSGAHSYVKHSYPVQLNAQSFLPVDPTQPKVGYTIIARAEQPNRKN